LFVLTRGRLVALVAFWAALVPASAAEGASPRFGARVLERGSHGRDVRVLQDYLTRAGFRAAVDGRFGGGTYRAVRRWEQESALAVDGRVTRRDAQVLRQKVSSVDSASMGPGGATYVQVEQGTVNPDGTAVAPAGAPDVVKQIIAAGNEIASKPYKYGGGHGRWDDSGYDCSGSISYALHGAGLLEEALDSTGFESFGAAGPGTWVTIYGNSGHAYMVVAGLRFDTSGARQRGSRWTTEQRSTRGYVVRHLEGL
jgi:peptidoglycan hydrolase-like protein with peptidoglycan-binding domain